MKNKHIYIPLFVFLGAGLVSLIASVIDFKSANKQLAYSSQSIQLNYEGASDGLDPNGRRFDATNFLTNDVIQAALQKSELTGEKYSVENVIQYIAIENVVPKNIVKEINSYESIIYDAKDSATGKITTKDYHPVRYQFIVYQDLGVSNYKLNELVKNLVDEYVSKFTLTYTNNMDQEAFDGLLDFSDYDYPYQIQTLSRKIDVIVSYGNELQAKNNDFRVNEKSFKDLDAIGQELISNLGVIDNTINLRSITKEPERLRDYYNYRILELEKEQDKYTHDLADITAQFNAYEKDNTYYVGYGETIEVISNNSGETYDSLLSRKLTVENRIASIEAEIQKVKGLRDKIDLVSDIDRQNIETRISNIKTKYEALEAEFSDLLTAYNSKYMNNNIVMKSKVSYQSSSLLSMTFVVRAIKIAAPIMLMTMLGIAIYYLARAVKKEKATKE